ncbi:hypothetical protein [Bosea sp. (in: a-proteobacteria)]|uniref:hypothetical protein n=1 Tax=Bosea sp. (in: a-proteobacteria) TaxID=1871050 RepID=UPI002FCBF3F3
MPDFVEELQQKAKRASAAVRRCCARLRPSVPVLTERAPFREAGWPISAGERDAAS